MEYVFHQVDDKFTFFFLKINLKQESSRSRILEIEPDEETPKVTLNERSGEFRFCGNSFPENAEEFYKPVFEWLQKYSENPRLFTLFEFKFKFLSTSSQKELIQIFNILELIASSSAVVVKWYFQKDNEDAFNFGLDFSKLFHIDFNLVEFDELDC